MPFVGVENAPATSFVIAQRISTVRGADQILVVEKPGNSSVDFRYRIFNSDGGEVEQCGNGARAFVKFVVDKGLTERRDIRVETMSGVIAPRLEDDGRITVDMGAPSLAADAVPFDASGLTYGQEHLAAVWPLEVNGKTTPVVVAGQLELYSGIKRECKLS